jgi:EmrB/QacA subfamily drug resistance transporter
LQTQRRVPLIIAGAVIMQQIDSTALATAIPAMAASLGVPPVGLHAVITSYLLALGIFLPLSGWIADRYGARNVFRIAMAIFAVASLLCAMAQTLPQLIAARVLQGFGGAMMVPVGRLLLVRSVPRDELVQAMIWMSMPAILGPAIGPLLGGFLTTAFSWHWIFLINLPVAVAAITLTTLYIPDAPPPQSTRSFDVAGFLLTALAAGSLVYSLDLAGHTGGREALLLAAGGLVLSGAYVLYARRRSDPILDLRLFRYPTFRASMGGSSLFRAGFGAIPFLLPLLMQTVLGYSALESGLITFVSAAGAFGMRTIARRILERFGFRRVLIGNVFIASASMALCASFPVLSSLWFIVPVILIGGFFRALQVTSINTLAFAQVTNDEMSHATTLSQMNQRLAQGAGVAFAALLLQAFGDGTGHPTGHAFTATFLVIGAVAALSVLSFIRLPDDAGNELAGRRRGRDPEA